MVANVDCEWAVLVYLLGRFPKTQHNQCLWATQITTKNIRSLLMLKHCPDAMQRVCMLRSRKQVNQILKNHRHYYRISRLSMCYVTGCFNGFDCDEVAYLAYDYSLSEVACQQWDDVNEVWGSDSCEVLPGSTATQTCVASSIIDVNTVFNNLDQKLIEVLKFSWFTLSHNFWTRASKKGHLILFLT